MLFIYLACFFWLAAAVSCFVKVYLFVRNQTHSVYYESSVCFSLVLDQLAESSPKLIAQ